MNAVFGLVDCNNFYVSCERVFDPALEGRPMVVLSNNDGCIISRSAEAKALNIAMGAPLFEAQPLIEKHSVVVYSSNYVLYGDMSQRVMASLAAFAPAVEIYSIDEAFLDLSGLADRELSAHGRRMRKVVSQWTGIPVSVGIAETKTLAKLASEIAKKSPAAGGVFELTGDTRRRQVLADIPVATIWGIGKQLAGRLKRQGIHTALEFHDAPDGWIRRNMGVVGLRTATELRGITCIDMETQPASRKSVVVSRSFVRPIERFDDLRDAVVAFAGRAAEKLRAGKLVGGSVTVFVRTNRFNPSEAQYRNAVTVSLDFPSNHTSDIGRAAREGLVALFRPGYRYKKAGVLLCGLVEESRVQPDLFAPGAGDRGKRLMEAFDTINQRLGRGMIGYGCSAIRRGWRTQQTRLSPRYTTDWNGLPIVRG